MDKRGLQFEPDIAAVAALIGDPSRATILWTLADGRALPAGELARAARVSAPTASAHLDKLFKGKLLAVEVQGRHHYYRLRDARVAEMLELLSSFAPLGNHQDLGPRPIALARTCYGHLAGKLGVAVTEALCSRSLLQSDDNGFRVTRTGETWFAGIGIDIRGLKRRPLAPWHIDWSERRHHLAGTLGCALATRMFQLKWFTRIDDSRALRVTDRGRAALHAELRMQMCYSS
jgi:DNA-binding transcriptional ArsR family regulator